MPNDYFMEWIEWLEIVDKFDKETKMVFIECDKIEEEQFGMTVEDWKLENKECQRQFGFGKF